MDWAETRLGLPMWTGLGFGLNLIWAKLCFVFLNDIKLHGKFMFLFRMKVFNGSSHGSTEKMTLKKKKTGFSECKIEFYQRLKVEDNLI